MHRYELDEPAKGKEEEEAARERTTCTCYRKQGKKQARVIKATTIVSKMIRIILKKKKK